MSAHGQQPISHHSPKPASVEVSELYYHYDDGTEALKGISFNVEPGACVGLVGPNGAGKSTLLLHLNGILPDAADATGCVKIGGVTVRPNNLPAIRRQVGLVFQDADDQLFCPTVFDDVAFGPRQFGLSEAEVTEAVKQALNSVGLSGFEQRAPHRLSGGEKRRACLAGILACGPGILVLDEPTSGLDPRGRRELILLLRGLSVTRIIATHDLELVLELCSHVLLLDDGELIAQGSAVELLSDETLMLNHGLERPASLGLTPRPVETDTKVKNFRVPQTS